MKTLFFFSTVYSNYLEKIIMKLFSHCYSQSVCSELSYARYCMDLHPKFDGFCLKTAKMRWVLKVQYKKLQNRPVWSGKYCYSAEVY